MKKRWSMTQRQCEIAAEAYAACLLAQAGYDVLVQYGANQPQYDLVAVKGDRILRVSVKGSQDGGWMLAVRYKEGKGYRSAIDSWLKAQHRELVYVFVQFIGVALGGAPRAYVSRPPDIAAHLRTQRDGKGGASLQEDIRRDRPRSRYSHKIPASWAFSRERIDGI